MKRIFIALILAQFSTSVFADVLTGKVFVNLNNPSEKIRVSAGNTLSITSKDFLEICGYSRESEGSYLNGTYSLSEKNAKTIINIKITSPCNSDSDLGGLVVENQGLQHIVFANAEGGIVFQEKLKK
jgi:hypothetical protein